jgi:DNA-damage-inducible protein J
MANVNIRVDDTLKKDVADIFSALGLSVSTATNMFYKQVVQYGGIPFDLRLDPFYSKHNQTHLRKAADNYESGERK